MIISTGEVPSEIRPLRKTITSKNWSLRNHSFLKWVNSKISHFEKINYLMRNKSNFKDFLIDFRSDASSMWAIMRTDPFSKWFIFKGPYFEWPKSGPMIASVVAFWQISILRCFCKNVPLIQNLFIINNSKQAKGAKKIRRSN